MKRIVFAGLLVAAVFVFAFAGCMQVPSGQDAQKTAITNFEECVAAGNPVMESYPRQCNANGKNFVEEIDFPVEMTDEAGNERRDASAENDNGFSSNVMAEDEARMIAEEKCLKQGESLTGAGYFNPNSKTWWFDANVQDTPAGCNPACVVSEETGEAEVNWRCTGLILPEAAPLQ